MQDVETQFINLQGIVIDYFKDFSNNQMIGVIDSFVYHKPVSEKDAETSKLIEKFLKENELDMAYVNYVSDLNKENQCFYKASSSEREMIDNLKQAFMNLAYNRFRQIDHTPPPALKKANKIKILGTSEVENSVHVVSNINNDYSLCSIMLDGSLTGETEKTSDAVDCKHCLSIVKMCKSIEI